MSSARPWQSTNPNMRATTRRIPDGTPCGYCFNEWATVWDHLQPWSKQGKTIPANLYPACRRCNALLAALSFPSIEEKREYVRTTLIERGDWNPIMEGADFMPDVSDALPEEAEDAEVLQPGVPQARMVGRSEKHPGVSDLSGRVRKTKTSSEVLQSKVPVGSVAKPKSRKPALKPRTCRVCRDVFTPRRKNQLFCDKVCQSNIGRGHDRLEKRLLGLLREEIDRKIPPLLELERPCSKCGGKGHRGRDACLTCSGIGRVLTVFGRSIVGLIDRRRTEIRW